MADSAVDITAGSGTSIDTRTESTNGHHRQVVVLGDPATNAGVAPVDATAGLKVDLGADNDVVVTNAGTFAVQNTPAAATTATLGNVAASATSVTLQASNSARRAVLIYNDSESSLYVKYGATASATSFTHKLGPFEALREELYSGVIDGIWDSATGSARCTELTA